MSLSLTKIYKIRVSEDALYGSASIYFFRITKLINIASLTEDLFKHRSYYYQDRTPFLNSTKFLDLCYMIIMQSATERHDFVQHCSTPPVWME